MGSPTGSGASASNQKIPLDRYLPVGTVVVSMRGKHREKSDWSVVDDPQGADLFMLEGDDSIVDPFLNSSLRSLVEDGIFRLGVKYVPPDVLIRIYLLPDDVARAERNINPKKRQKQLAAWLSILNVAPEAWHGDTQAFSAFDRWATAENGSLFYIFNTLPSPAPNPEKLQSSFLRRIVLDVLEENYIAGLATPLYPFQSRSIANMIQRESQPELYLDPRLEPRYGPEGTEYYYSPREVSFYRHPRQYEGMKGGILAESMGLGKTLICLGLILATKNHLPEIPAQYLGSLNLEQSRVPRLLDLAMKTALTSNIPIKALLTARDRWQNVDSAALHTAWDNYKKTYTIPSPEKRSRSRRPLDPDKTILLSCGTIVVVPNTLVHHWREELTKHCNLDEVALNVLYMDKAGLELPEASKLAQYDLVVFTRTRFEKESKDFHDSKERDPKQPSYSSPLKDIHWLRIIIDEGHSFSSPSTSAVNVAINLVKAERRWIVSGTPGKDRLYDIDVEVTKDSDADVDKVVNGLIDLQCSNVSIRAVQEKRRAALEQRKNFDRNQEPGGAAKSIGQLMANFLQAAPWTKNQSFEDIAEWDHCVYRHENLLRQTYHSFSTCLRRTLEQVVIKTRAEDVDSDLTLPPLHRREVILEPSFYDKLTANLFCLVMNCNFVTSERQDVDYLFHKNSAKARYQLISNLRKSNFYWTGLSRGDVENSIQVAKRYLAKENTKCTPDDRRLLKELIQLGERTIDLPVWAALTKYHEMGIFVKDWPDDSERTWALEKTSQPMLVGATQLLYAQKLVDSQIFSHNPLEHFTTLGKHCMAKATEDKEERVAQTNKNAKSGVPSSALDQKAMATKPVLNRSVPTSKSSPAKKSSMKDGDAKPTSMTPELKTLSSYKNLSPTARRDYDSRPLSPTSTLRKPQIIGTVSAKFSYLLSQVTCLASEEKILIFYDCPDTAWYIAQALDLVHIKNLIYAKTLGLLARDRYVRAFKADESIRVFLMDVNRAAEGIDLHVASRVFFVNPVCRPRVMAQAMKRTHRIGQKRPVYVETLVLKGSIEQGILERSARMTFQEHVQVSNLEDDQGVASVIQAARPMEIEEEEWCAGSKQIAALTEELQIFGREGRGDKRIEGIDKDVEPDTAAMLGKRVRGEEEEQTVGARKKGGKAWKNGWEEMDKKPDKDAQSEAQYD